jgi:hypothetical protein
MNTNRNVKILRASAIGAAAAVSLPAVLFAGTGTAHAETNPTYFTNPDGTIEVIYGGGGLALYATIVDAGNPHGATEVCHYHSVGVMTTPALPYDADTLVTGPNPSAPVTIIFQQLGGTYSVTVTCYGTGNSAGYSPVVY